MRLALLFVLILVFCVCGCKTVNVLSTQNKTVQEITLGSISSSKENILQNDISLAAIPKYKEPLKLMVTPKPFKKQTFSKFKEAQMLQSDNFVITYIDSLPEKPKYLEIKIADYVGLIKALNSEQNNEVKTYVSQNRDANVITGISLAFNAQDLEDVVTAESIFLVETGFKTYGLQLYSNVKKTRTISFKNGVVFQYLNSHFCWKEDIKHHIEIVDLVSHYSSCPSHSYRSASRAKKSTNTYKF